jgi:hypothetical protein
MPTFVCINANFSQTIEAKLSNCKFVAQKYIIFLKITCLVKDFTKTNGLAMLLADSSINFDSMLHNGAIQRVPSCSSGHDFQLWQLF